SGLRTIPVGSCPTGITRTTVTLPSPRRSTATPFGDRGFALISDTKQEQPSFERTGSNGCPGTSTNASESAMAWLQPRGLAVPWADTRGASATPRERRRQEACGERDAGSLEIHGGCL